MGSLATLLPAAHNASPADPVIDNAPDELNDLSYLVEVLRSVETEQYIEQDLTTRAAALGISIPAPPSPSENAHCPDPESDATQSCICCRDDFNKQNDLQTLPCGHTYCGNCLRIMIEQSTTDESKMPPRCCTQPILATTIRNLLTRDEQQLFLKAVQQYSTPWEARIFCPNPCCNEFIPPRSRIDPKHPFDVVCRECRTRVCIWCKRDAHPVGQDCPNDHELDQVLRMGCPNFCNGEEELERRRMEEAAREAELEAEKEAQEAAAAAAEVERQQAVKRTEACEEFKKLKEEQEEEKWRFRTFERKTKGVMWTRHEERKHKLNEKYSDQIDKMKERHAKTEQHLEERQIAAEIELRASLEQAEKSVRIRVKHMEAYCKALGRSSIGGSGSDMPPRVITERHLRELGQQHNALEGMARLHQAKINVLRDRQAKRMEELLERQESELQKQREKRDQEMEDLVAELANEEDALAKVFKDRKERLVRRWELAIEILRVTKEKEKGVKFAPIPSPAWPAEAPSCIDGLGSEDAGLAVVKEEEEKRGETEGIAIAS
ncbi:putative ibr domain-containing protein [Diaporthe ampelina]|uniref:Putative ibr domain-containing protein n=1 Tax=Diaporthe ampelina TaxID=1214573 RepID=A0A0G2FGG5_9PEZI|nr:putative ibr domain-containing protein [Diaporthe ampelina]